MVAKKPRKPSPTEDLLARLQLARAQPESPASRATVSEALASPRNVAVAAAARAIAEAEQRDFIPALVAAFQRLLIDAATVDPMCKGKVALVAALLGLDAGEPELFLAGIRHRQPEPAYGVPGGTVDTAAELRGTCALGLLRARHPQASLLVAQCLADPEPAARAGAAHALGELDPTAALPLLRFKLATGDSHPEVVGASFASFLDHAPGPALELGASWLEGPSDAFAEAVALALGESRKPEAFPLLRDYGARADDAGRAVALVALALLRDEQANAHLLQLVAEGRKSHAADAVRALATFRHDPRLKQQVLDAAVKRGDQELLAQVARRFERPG